MNKRRSILGLTGALVATVVLTGTAAVPAFAAAPVNLVANGDFSQGVALDAGTTDFTWTDGAPRPAGDTPMYDPGMYTIGANPNALHRLWAEFPGGDKMMIVNGMDTAPNSLVWAQDVTLPVPVETYKLLAGSDHQYVGTITVRPEAAGKVCVNYELTAAAIAEGYLINEIHIATGTDAAQVPQGNGGPIPGKFAVNKSYSPGVTNDEICGVDANTVIAAHAAVSKTVVTNGVSVTTSKTAWSEGTKFVGKNVWATWSSYPTTNSHTYDFSMIATNVLPAGAVPNTETDPGAKLTVSINGKQIGAPVLLTDVNANNKVEIKGTVLAGTARIEIRNDTTKFWGNDFAIDDISLTQAS